MRDKRRLNQRGLDFLGEDFVGDLELLPAWIDAQPQRLGFRDFLGLGTAEVINIARDIPDQVLVAHLAPLASELDFLSTCGVLDPRRAEHIATQRRQQISN